MASQLALRMPFSSPTAEQALSPVSPTLSYNSLPGWQKMDEKRHDKGNTYPRKISTIPKVTKRESWRRQERNLNKSRWPGLNVVTNFSKSSGLVPGAADAVAPEGQKEALKAENAQTGFVTLSDIKIQLDNKGKKGFKTHNRNKGSGAILRSDLELRYYGNPEKSIIKSDERSAGLGLQHYGDPPDYNTCLLADGKDQMDGLKPSSTKIIGLSPSDRPIIIGISIPSARLAEHSISPEVGPTPLTPQGYATNRGVPATPTIIVTPARDDEPWTATFDERDEASPRRRHAASSIYSRATHYGQGWSPQMDVPPVPVPPQKYVVAKEDGSKNSAESHDRMGLGRRVDSDDTIFEEDDQAVEPDPDYSISREPQTHVSKPPRINTVRRRHPSHGWWNYILSPFATRSNTMVFKGNSPSSAGSLSTPSSPKSEVVTLHDQHSKHFNPVSSPLAEKLKDTKTDRTSLHTDNSPVESEGSKFRFNHTPAMLGLSDFGSPASFDGFGAAAEYYHACWHDQNSPNPYFDCQNHSCLPLGSDDHFASNSLSKGSASYDTTRGASDTENDGHVPNGFQQKPSNRFSAAFSLANRVEARPLSEATEVEDLDETPMVQEAHAAAVLHACVPIATFPVASSIARSPPVTSSANDQNKSPLNTGKENSCGIVEDPQNDRSSSIQQLSSYTYKSQRAPKGFVAIMPPNQLPVTRETPSPVPSISPKPPFARQSQAPESSLFSKQSSSRDVASTSPFSSKPPNSGFQESPSTFPTQTATSEAPFSSDQMIPKAPTPRSKLPLSSGIPLSSTDPSSNFTRDKILQPSAIADPKVLPSSDPPASSTRVTSISVPPFKPLFISKPLPSSNTASQAGASADPPTAFQQYTTYHTRGSDLLTSSGSPVSSGYVAPGSQPVKSRISPSTTPPSTNLPLVSSHTTSRVPPSLGPSLSRKEPTSEQKTPGSPLLSDDTAFGVLQSHTLSSSNGDLVTVGSVQPTQTEPFASQFRGIPRKAVPRDKDPNTGQPQLIPPTYIVNNYYDGLGPNRSSEQAPSQILECKRNASHTDDGNRELGDEKVPHSQVPRLRSYIKKLNCFGQNRERKKVKRSLTKKKKRFLWGVAISLVILIVLILALVMTLTRKGDGLNVQSQWLNITGFPPIPTGISTIIQPDAVHESSTCVQPATMWSCAVPKEEQESISPNDADQPNFRVEIRFQNGTISNSSSNTAKSTKRSRDLGMNPVSASTFIRRTLLHTRETFTSNLFSPSPSPPTQEDQMFLGNTTDKVAQPFNGESTPFFISFLSASKLPQRRLVKRQKSQSGNTTNLFPNVTDGIPPPDINPDGTAAPANLLPFPVAQPLRLFDRGLLTEHYGFYNYFDRSIFLKSTSLLSDSGPITGDVPDDQDGGAEESSATVRCTWRQTRFLVQIWTNQGSASPLLRSANYTSSEKEKAPKNLTESTANDFVRPGSFPYPVTITIDRHGGDLDNKFIYCYGMDDRGHIIADHKKIQLEDRASGNGVLVNPALGLFGKVNVTRKDGGPGGIDGGTGGCGCQWSNFESN